MRRLMKRPFQFEKEKYLFIVDTNGLDLILRCYKGSNEKSESIEPKRFSPLHNKIIEIIDNEESSAIVRNICSSSTNLSLEMREYYQISFPENEYFSSLEINLNELGFLELSEDDVQFFNYLEWKKIKYVKFPHNDKLMVYTSEEKLRELSNNIFKIISEKKKEIEELQNLIYQLDRYEFQLKR